MKMVHYIQDLSIRYIIFVMQINIEVSWYLSQRIAVFKTLCGAAVIFY